MKPLAMPQGEPGPSVVFNVPELFEQPEFVTWLNEPAIGKFTWHVPGTPTHEFSDVIVLVDPGLDEGSNDEMPGWNDVLQALRTNYRPGQFATHITVRLTNLR